MANVWIREFSGGLDVRKLRETSPGGTLIHAVDCHINRGGEIEQRADFVPVYQLPAGQTRGLAATPTGLVVFTGAGGATGMPSGVTAQTLNFAAGGQLRRVEHTTLYNGQIAAIGTFANGPAVRAFLNGATITDANAPPNKAGSQNPAVLLTASQKLLIGAGPDMFFSAAGAGTNFTASQDAGFVVVSTETRGAERLTGLAIYSDYVAVFARRVVVIFFFDPDPALTRRAQVLRNTGAYGPRAIVEFGDEDLFYLDASGIRSLRARDSSRSAVTSDIGAPIDALVTAQIASIPEDDAARAVGVIEPKDQRLWMAIRDRIYVFSYFPASKVSAWSEYRPGFVVEDMVEFEDRIYIRSGDTIYVYGGTGPTFQYSSDVQAEAWLPYLDADQPAREKELTGIDTALRGKWEIRVGLDPRDLTASDRVGVVDRTTFGEGMIPAGGMSSHMSLRFKCLAPESATEPAVVSSAMLHFLRDAEEDA
jgi:hypothetical protein